MKDLNYNFTKVEPEDLLIAGFFFPHPGLEAASEQKSEACFKGNIQCENSDRAANFFIHSAALLFFFPIKANATETVIKPGLGSDCLLL